MKKTFLLLASFIALNSYSCAMDATTPTPHERLSQITQQLQNYLETNNNIPFELELELIEILYSITSNTSNNRSIFLLQRRTTSPCPNSPTLFSTTKH